ncbi:TIGR03618 family F420-dependent PPOX class oxidoreductase [Nocardia sp. NPDC088792]|uniref:TIGR03618 family F420-dependent PPOX class oxidoreductase n=1 Tax=Nocardia sp. NPDC088792 TaxID=3364332 RepID=UPI0037FBA952
MPTTPLPAEVAEFLAQPNPAVFASNKPDGQPVSVATWYLYEDGRILVNLADFRKRLDWLREDPRVTLTVLGSDSWYTHVSVQGRIVSLENDPDSSVIDRIAQHYLGTQYGVRDQKRVSAWIEIESWHGWGKYADAK